jgi:hypothetical protein
MFINYLLIRMKLSFTMNQKEGLFLDLEMTVLLHCVINGFLTMGILSGKNRHESTWKMSKRSQKR